MNYFLRTSIVAGLLMTSLPAFANWIYTCAKDACVFGNSSSGFNPDAFKKLVEKYRLNVTLEAETYRPIGEKSVPAGTTEYFWLDRKLKNYVFVPRVGPHWDEKDLQPDNLQAAKDFCEELIQAGRYKGQVDIAKPEDSVVYATVWGIRRVIAVGYRTEGNNLKYYYCRNPWNWEGDAI